MASAMSELVDADGWPLVVLNDDGIRPAGTSDACFYCRQSVGHPHSRDCVIVQKKVRLRYVFEIDVMVPHHWTAENVEFHRNESSWCADNAVDELEKLTCQLDERGCGIGPCLCPNFRCEFVKVVDQAPVRELQSAEQVATSDAIRAGIP